MKTQNSICDTCRYPIHQKERKYKSRTVNYFTSRGNTQYYYYKYGGKKEVKNWVQCDWCVQEWQKEKMRDEEARAQRERDKIEKVLEIEEKKQKRNEKIRQTKKEISWIKHIFFLVLLFFYYFFGNFLKKHLII